MIGKHSADFNTKYHNSETAGRRFAAKKSDPTGYQHDSFSDFLSIFAV